MESKPIIATNLCRRTQDNLTYLIEKGIVTNEIEGIDIAVESITTEYKIIDELKNSKTK